VAATSSIVRRHQVRHPCSVPCSKGERQDLHCATVAWGYWNNDVLHTGGKSVVADILMLRRLHSQMQHLPKSARRQHHLSTVPVKALLVLPYISVVSEKSDQMAGLVKGLKWKVRGYLGSQEGVPLSRKVSHSCGH
jgi:hypothetical protein